MSLTQVIPSDEITEEHGSRVFLVNELFELAGTPDRLPPHLVQRKRAVRFLYSLRFLIVLPFARRGYFLFESPHSNLIRHKVRLSDGGIAIKALRCVATIRPFFLARTTTAHPVRRLCEHLQVDCSNELSCYLSINLALILFAEKDGHPIVLHVGRSQAARSAVARHEMGIRVVATAHLPQPVRALIPETLFSGEISGYLTLVQTRMPGAPLDHRTASDGLFYAAINKAYQQLLNFRASSPPPERGPDWERIFVQYPQALAALPELHDMLEPLLHELQAWQKRRGLVGILTHGDYWLGNVLFDRSDKVSGIVDWERSRVLGTPGLDALNLMILSLVMYFDGPITSYLEQAWTGRWESGHLTEYVARIQSDFDLSPNDIGHLAGILCFEEFSKRHITGKAFPASRVDEWLEMAPVLRSWLARVGES